MDALITKSFRLFFPLQYGGPVCGDRWTSQPAGDWLAYASFSVDYESFLLQVLHFSFPAGVTIVTVEATTDSKRCAIISIQNNSVSEGVMVCVCVCEGVCV